MSWTDKDLRQGTGKLFRPRSPKERTVRKAVDFCVVQVALLIFCIFGMTQRWTTLQMLCILAELFEWRFFSLSIRLRRYEEETEEKRALREKRNA